MTNKNKNDETQSGENTAPILPTNEATQEPATQDTQCPNRHVKESLKVGKKKDPKSKITIENF